MRKPASTTAGVIGIPAHLRTLRVWFFSSVALIASDEHHGRSGQEQLRNPTHPGTQLNRLVRSTQSAGPIGSASTINNIAARDVLEPLQVYTRCQHKRPLRDRRLHSRMVSRDAIRDYLSAIAG